jgi:tetratricopeptide (TPR) repeat protein
MSGHPTRWSLGPIGCALLLSWAGLAWAPSAAAQTAESQAAEALFRQAKALLDRGELEPACEKFAASQALEPGLGTLLYLGDCYERAGRFASALATFREATEVAEQRGDTARLRLAQVRVSALEPRAPKLEIRRGPAPQPVDLQITVGGVPLPSTDLGKPLPRDAGSYEIRFSAPGHEPFVSHIDLKNADGVIVTVPRLVPVTGPARAVLSENDEAPEDSSQRTLAWVVGGTGAALLATAGVFAGLAASKNRNSKGDCNPDSPNRCGPAGVELRNDARSLANVATVATVLGGVGLAGGAVLYFSAPDTEAPLGQAAMINVEGTLF